MSDAELRSLSCESAFLAALCRSNFVTGRGITASSLRPWLQRLTSTSPDCAKIQQPGES
jgi:hypothetical protein